jgi:hypothetical protein
VELELDLIGALVVLLHRLLRRVSVKGMMLAVLAGADQQT